MLHVTSGPHVQINIRTGEHEKSVTANGREYNKEKDTKNYSER